MTVKKHRLQYTEKYDFLLLGISSAENDYRLIWNINQHLGLAFVKTDNHKVMGKDGKKEYEFSNYRYEDEDTFLNYRFIANKSDEGPLIDELKNIDYLLVVQGDYTASFTKDLVSGLKNIEHVNGVFRIDPESLKYPEKLLV